MKNKESIKSTLQSLRQRGYHITSQSEIIIQVISRSDKHMTAEEVYKEIQ